MNQPLLAAAVLLPLAAVPAQTLDDLRDAIRDELEHARYAQFLVALVDITEETELTGANYEIDDDVNLDLSVLGLPFHTRVPLGSSSTQLYLEGNLGYLTGEAVIPDLFPGVAGLENTSVDTKWTAYSALGGVGLEFPILDGVTLTPIVDLSIARVENRAGYAGAGAGFASALLDGILFNWDATVFTYGGGLRGDWNQPLGEDHDMELVLRYDLFQSETLDSTDAAQEFSEDSQRLTARLDFTGPMPWDLFESPLGWRTILGYRRFLSDTGEALGVDDFIEVGAGLELKVLDRLPVVSELSLTGALIFGHNITGWTLGLGVSF